MGNNIATAEDMKNSAIIERVKAAKRTADAINRAAIGEFVRFNNKIFAISEIETAEIEERKGERSAKSKYFYNVAICTKKGGIHSFERCSMEEFDTLTGKLGA